MCPIDIFYQNIQNTFFKQLFLYTQKNLLEKLFFIYKHWLSVPSLITMLFKTLYWKNTYLSFSSENFFYIINRVYTHCWMIPKELKLFKENKIQWKKMFSPKYKFSFLWSVLCTPTDNNVPKKSFSSKKLSIIFYQNIIFK